MALIPIRPWKRDSTYRVHPLGLKDSTYRAPLLDSKLVRLRYAWYYRIKSPSGPSSGLAALGTPQPSFVTLNAVEPRLTYPNLYLFYTSYSYNSISRYAYCGISAHIPRRDLVIFCVLRSHWLPLIRARMAASCETTGEYEV